MIRIIFILYLFRIFPNLNSETSDENSENRQSLFKYNKELNRKIYIG